MLNAPLDESDQPAAQVPASLDANDTSNENANNPYAAPQTRSQPAQSHSPRQAEPSRRFTPILISSLVFSLFHLGHGPAPISLFFLSLVLGYLYQRTQRIWPSLVVHTLLNFCTTVILWFDLLL